MYTCVAESLSCTARGPKAPGRPQPPPSSRPLSVPPSSALCRGRGAASPLCRAAGGGTCHRGAAGLPQAGVQSQPRRCLTTSTQKTTWTQGPSMCEKMGNCTWSIWPWMVSGVACRSQGLSDCFPKAFLWSFA